MIQEDIMDIMRTQFKIDMSDVHTAIPCKIVNVYGNLENQKVDVIPSVNNLLKDGTEEPGMQILGVPVIFPSSTHSMISWPLTTEDTVWVMFSQRSMDYFKIGNGEPTVANDYRKFSDQDAVAIPGLFPFAKSPNRPSIRKYPHEPGRDLSIAHNIASGTEVNILLKQNGDMIVNTEAKVQINCKVAELNATESSTINTPLQTVNAAQTNWTGNITLMGNITHTGNTLQTGSYTQVGSYTLTGGVGTFNGIEFNTHRHTGVQTGSGTSGGPTA